jgi:hypothetical protein
VFNHPVLDVVTATHDWLHVQAFVSFRARTGADLIRRR